MKTLLCLLWAFFALNSCKTSGKITNRYKSKVEKDVGKDIDKIIDVNALFFRPDPAPSVSVPRRLVADLPEAALAEFIKQVAVREQTTDKLITKLNTEIGRRTANTEEFIDLTVIPRRLMVTVTDKTSNSANRIDLLRAFIKFPPALRLLSCNRFETSFATIDIGKQTFSNSIAGKLAANLTSGLTAGLTESSNTKDADTSKPTELNTVVAEASNGLSNTLQQTSTKGLSAELNASRNYSEEVLLRQRIVNISATINQTSNSLILSQEGTVGIKLDGNANADLTIDTRANTAVERTYVFDNLTDSTGAFNNAGRIKPKGILVAYLNSEGDVSAEITFYARYRRVIRGERTVSESDDDIELIHGSTVSTVDAVKTANKANTPDTVKTANKVDASKITVVLLHESDYKPTFWLITDNDSSAVPALKIYNPLSGGSGNLLFPTPATASSFLGWIKSQKQAIFSPQPPKSPQPSSQAKGKGKPVQQESNTLASNDKPTITRIPIGNTGHFIELVSGASFTEDIIDKLLIAPRLGKK